MNNLSKQQKAYAIVSLAVVVILAVITVWKKPDYHYKDTTDYAKLQAQSVSQQVAYDNYLASIQTDPVASEKLFKQIITRQDVADEVKAELNTDQPINPPVVDEKSLVITNNKGQAAVESYLTEAISPLVNFNQASKDLNSQLFGADASVPDSIKKLYTRAYNQLAAAPVPQEAVGAQKSLMSAYLSYGQLLDLSKSYASGGASEPWADLYQDYAAMNASFADFNQNFKSLTSKYKIAFVPIVPDTEYAGGKSSKNYFVFIPEAKAFLGGMSITIDDIPRTISDAIQEGLVSSFSQFMDSFLDKMIQKIEDNYKIANFLYYSDALVNGQYADDYLNKYVSDSLDRQIV